MQSLRDEGKTASEAFFLRLVAILPTLLQVCFVFLEKFSAFIRRLLSPGIWLQTFNYLILECRWYINHDLTRRYRHYRPMDNRVSGWLLVMGYPRSDIPSWWRDLTSQRRSAGSRLLIGAIISASSPGVANDSDDMAKPTYLCGGGGRIPGGRVGVL